MTSRQLKMLRYLVFAAVLALGQMAHVPMTSGHDWGNNIKGHFVFPATELIDGWELIIRFSSPMVRIQEMDDKIGKVVKKSDDGLLWIISNRPEYGIALPGTQLDIVFQGQFAGDTAPTAVAELINFAKDGQTVPTVVPSTGTKYNYDELLEKSILFYEAQRSGKLPPTNRIPWRGDSALNDHGQSGEDLTGGWYDAGDHIKFGLPMSSTVTLLAWSMLRFKDAYEHAGQLEYAYDCIRWPLEWMLKCHTAPEELYVQVGDGGPDHAYWGRPEDMTFARPSYKVDATKPGSDVAGEYAAAMAASYLVFKDKDPDFAAKLLTHAKQLNDFANKYHGRYSDSVTAAAAFYRSDAYEDELSWAGAWLYKVTNETKYLTQAEQFYVGGAAWGQSWDEKIASATILLYELTGKDVYLQDIETTFTEWMPGGTVPYTPKGLAFRLQWGALRYASNMAFMALIAAEDGIHSDAYRAWAMSQIHYALGDTGRSFVVGFGVNPPTHPHHRAASCPSMPAPCSHADLKNVGPSPHTLYGALVGGPGGTDDYKDNRENYVNNEVACDYNSGFQGASSALESLSLRGLLPASSP
ncbi:uncharacterized protein LOC110456829 isoform X1 [Mizuhopecten yessoensis]|uniref:uncharacterized protein LOC110456829 isoform X1 n=1 Tax=Mizuhopecten yessoensis TaxID=6573 RepID=UPI000B459A5C|nr:uncharacterized protein LOC110456829 isoform X1 [Mizuhopecten yessoensis]